VVVAWVTLSLWRWGQYVLRNVYHSTGCHILENSNLQYCKNFMKGFPALFADIAETLEISKSRENI
jgi:hypothetical protein